MDGLRGVGGVPDPAPERPADLRNRPRDELKTPAVQDGLHISSTAQQAATVKSLVELAREDPGMRLDRVAAAKERIARGDYKRPDIVAKVADKISPQLPE